jgi:penicillin-binding protein 1C
MSEVGKPRPGWRRLWARLVAARVVSSVSARQLTCAAAVAAAAITLGVATQRSIREFPDDPLALAHNAVKTQVLARDGTPLSYTLENGWNTTDTVPLASVPVLLQRAFIMAEDQHFYEHHGVDWPARFAAAWQNIRAMAGVRGAGSITEQVVRMIHPRPRTLWSHWIEGFEAARLERRLSKAQILEFYLNQVPYADRRRGVVQAAHLYFNRGLDTLSPAEQLSLAVLVRSPSGMDLRRNRPRAQRSIDVLADRMYERGDLTADQHAQVRADPLSLDTPTMALDASHFVSHVLEVSARSGQAVPSQIRTTLDPEVQLSTQHLLDAALVAIAKRKVHDGAVLVIDTQRNEIQAWVVGRAASGGVGADVGAGAGGDGVADDAAANGYDTLLTPRQPGSTMKPLLYALALERGWTAATLIDDSELAESVGGGQHTFHNYSHVHYGPLRLREALGNSLNIPAVKTLKFVQGDRFLDRLHEVGITSLTQHPDFYGDGLALGNGEISVFEMAQAYTALARQGRYMPLTFLAEEADLSNGAGASIDAAAAAANGAGASNDDRAHRAETQVYSPEAATLVANILADPDARMLEFGKGLQFPVDTAVKTGTSTDYRDAWAIGFDYRHTVAVWMGNLDGAAMDGVTGAVGPAMVLRSVFSELNRNQDTRDLPLSRKLVLRRICRRDGRLADETCASTDEWFVPGTLPDKSAPPRAAPPDYRVTQPTAGLQVAHDPRIPAQFEALPMQVAPVAGLRRVEWIVDGRPVTVTNVNRYAWPLVRGTHEVYSRIWDSTSIDPHVTNVVRFYVH